MELLLVCPQPFVGKGERESLDQHAQSLLASRGVRGAADFREWGQPERESLISLDARELEEPHEKEIHQAVRCVLAVTHKVDRGFALGVIRYEVGECQDF